MNEKTKTRSLITIILFLLVTNVAMLIFFILLNKPTERRPRYHEQNGLYNSLQNEVGFSKDQLAKYQALREQQMKEVHPLFNEVREAKKNFYELIYSSETSDSLANADADSISQKQKDLDIQMFHYFKNIRNICSPDQAQKFDSVINKVVMRMVGGRPGKGNRRPGK
ncbi:MAG: hypothetical protein ABI267_09620 [Ginsengibacter sp.]